MSEDYSYLPPEDIAPADRAIRNTIYEDPFANADMKELLLDFSSIGLFIIGLRAILEPEKYGDSEFIQNAVETVKYMGWATDEGIHAPVEVLELAFPSRDNNGFQ